MSTLLITILLAAALTILAGIGLGIGYLITGKSKFSCKRCGTPPDEKKDKDSCELCSKSKKPPKSNS